jgi:hypothetical protein
MKYIHGEGEASSKEGKELVRKFDEQNGIQSPTRPLEVHNDIQTAETSRPVIHDLSAVVPVNDADWVRQTMRF